MSPLKRLPPEATTRKFCNNKMNNNLTWNSIQNWIPIVVIALGVAGTFATLDRRLALVEQKLDNLIVLQREQLQKYSDVETRYGSIAIRVSILETRAGIK